MPFAYLMRGIWGLNFLIYAYLVPIDFMRGNLLTFTGVWDVFFLLASIWANYRWWIQED